MAPILLKNIENRRLGSPNCEPGRISKTTKNHPEMCDFFSFSPLTQPEVDAWGRTAPFMKEGVLGFRMAQFLGEKTQIPQSCIHLKIRKFLTFLPFLDPPEVLNKKT